MDIMKNVQCIDEYARTLTCFNTLQKPVNIQASASLIGESVSEPHTSEFNGRISLIYYIYVSHIVRPMHTYACRMRDICYVI